MANSKNSSSNSPKSNELYAIAETSGQQFWFEVDRYYDIDRLNAKEKDKITLEKVLLFKDKDSITVGKPYIKNAKIELEVVSHRRDKKILVYKMRPKKKTRRKMGHRQELTRVMVKSISIGKSSPKSSAKKDTVKKETKPKSEKPTN
tara:strand:+ start:106 stop:546 length:441 start_codon:yes stop_codon:yes gene_type:complete